MKNETRNAAGRAPVLYVIQSLYSRFKKIEPSVLVRTVMEYRVHVQGGLQLFVQSYAHPFFMSKLCVFR